MRKFNVLISIGCFFILAQHLHAASEDSPEIIAESQRLEQERQQRAAKEEADLQRAIAASIEHVSGVVGEEEKKEGTVEAEQEREKIVKRQSDVAKIRKDFDAKIQKLQIQARSLEEKGEDKEAFKLSQDLARLAYQRDREVEKRRKQDYGTDVKQIDVLEQQGTDCGYHAVKNGYWTLKYLKNLSSQQEWEKNIRKEGAYFPLEKWKELCPRQPLLEEKHVEKVLATQLQEDSKISRGDFTIIENPFDLEKIGTLGDQEFFYNWLPEILQDKEKITKGEPHVFLLGNMSMDPSAQGVVGHWIAIAVYTKDGERKYMILDSQNNAQLAQIYQLKRLLTTYDYDVVQSAWPAIFNQGWSAAHDAIVAQLNPQIMTLMSVFAINQKVQTSLVDAHKSRFARRPGDKKNLGNIVDDAGALTEFFWGEKPTELFPNAWNELARPLKQN